MFDAAAVGPVDRLADAEPDQSRADRRQDRHAPFGYVGFGGIDEAHGSLGAAFFVDEGDARSHRDDIGRYNGTLADRGAVDLVEPQLIQVDRNELWLQSGLGRMTGRGS